MCKYLLAKLRGTVVVQVVFKLSVDKIHNFLKLLGFPYVAIPTYKEQV